MPSAILAIDTSTPLGSVAVVRGGAVDFEMSFSSERSHNSRLFAPLREALAACEGSLRAVVVGTGPASYTGVRIGIAAAQGVAMSRNVPVIGLPSVLAVDLNHHASAYCVCGDARRGSFFLAEVRDDALIGGIRTCDAAGLRSRHAAPDALWFTFDAKAPLGLEGVHSVTPSAARLATIASNLSDDELARRAQHPLEPVYLSAPFVTMPK